MDIRSFALTEGVATRAHNAHVLVPRAPDRFIVMELQQLFEEGKVSKLAPFPAGDLSPLVNELITSSLSSEEGAVLSTLYLCQDDDTDDAFCKLHLICGRSVRLLRVLKMARFRFEKDTAAVLTAPANPST